MFKKPFWVYVLYFLWHCDKKPYLKALLLQDFSPCEKLKAHMGDRIGFDAPQVMPRMWLSTLSCVEPENTPLHHKKSFKKQQCERTGMVLTVGSPEAALPSAGASLWGTTALIFFLVWSPPPRSVFSQMPFS